MVVLATNQETIVTVVTLLVFTVGATIMLWLAPLWLPQPEWMLNSNRFLWIAIPIIALEGAWLVILILQ